MIDIDQWIVITSAKVHKELGKLILMLIYVNVSKKITLDFYNGLETKLFIMINIDVSFTFKCAVILTFCIFTFFFLFLF